ncbi:MAG TPA: hypothetical protein VK280_10980 [Streptosporangiaceae bacterium]|nr:hypothetical protein [Streptosporangiaceae bacterium]
MTLNLVPSQYRNVSVANVPVALDEESLRTHLQGRPVYRRTRYLVARHGSAAAVVEVSKESELPLFSPVIAMSVIARPDETAFVDAPGTDTAVPTQMARVAAQQAPGARCVIVRGRYGHVSFILDPAPIRIRVVEVVPPWPPKLADQLNRVLDLAEDLPPVELVPHLVDLDALAATRPARHYLFPCRAGQPAQDQPRGAAEVSYLDEIPERAPWTLVGCARSKSIHDWFYGDDVPMVDMCPRRLAESDAAPGGSAGAPGSVPVITKCCLLEDRVDHQAGLVVVPWGASMAQIREGLRLALGTVAVPTAAAPTAAAPTAAAPSAGLPR